MANFVEMFTATLHLYKECFFSASSILMRNWILPIAAVLAFLAFMLAAFLVTPLGIAGRFLLGLIYIYLLTIFYGWLIEARRPSPIKLSELTRFDYGLFSNLISVGFILWIADYLLRPLATDIQTRWFFAIVQIAIFIVLNCVAEVIYLHRLEGVSALRHSVGFITTNWPEWFLPQILLLTPLFMIWPSIVLMTWSNADPLLPISVLINQMQVVFLFYLPDAGLLIGGSLAVIISIWFMFFRAELFSELESGSRRMRAYQNKRNG